MTVTRFFDLNSRNNALPEDVIFAVFCYLNFADIVNNRRINTVWKNLSDKPDLWQLKLIIELGIEDIPKAKAQKYYEHLSALKQNKIEVYNDFLNFALHSSLEFEQEKEYVPIFGEEIKVANLTGREIVNYFKDAVKAANIQLILSLSRLGFIRDDNLLESFRNSISKIFSLGRLSSLKLLALPNKFLDYFSIACCAALSGNIELIKALSEESFYSNFNALAKFHISLNVARSRNLHLLIYLLHHNNNILYLERDTLLDNLESENQYNLVRMLATSEELRVKTSLKTITRQIVDEIHQQHYEAANNLINFVNSQSIELILTPQSMMAWTTKFANCYYAMYQSKYSNEFYAFFYTKLNCKFNSRISTIFAVDAPKYKDLKYLKSDYIKPYLNLHSDEIVQSAVDADFLAGLQYIILQVNYSYQPTDLFLKSLASPSVRQWLSEKIRISTITQENVNQVFKDYSNKDYEWFVSFINAKGLNLQVDSQVLNLYTTEIPVSKFVYLKQKTTIMIVEELRERCLAYANSIISFSIFNDSKNYQTTDENLLAKLIYPKQAKM